MDDTSWQIELRIRDGRLGEFTALMEEALGVAADDRSPDHAYIWSLGGDRGTAVIAKTEYTASTTGVAWTTDWPTARRHFARIGPSFAADVLALAGPVNLATFGDGEPETPDDTSVSEAMARRSGERARRLAKTTGCRTRPGWPGVGQRADDGSAGTSAADPWLHRRPFS